ncbi:VWA domain-containing protein [Rathayibacter sp. VKM Ac-2857]|uniref:VWA domain-containing protein n=1 Tax=Rathayibacter sp. VKM Ac-2857 TaxID=2739020 RepID=UPI001564A400|nr:VWA domain-containing protein [Rathayibacter sp. VKM Ac-2857]NQX16045.1 VWA domain-containing protein [Rathayibacter sp. VKM Ac-2857]
MTPHSSGSSRPTGSRAWILPTAAGALVLLTLVTGAVLTVPTLLGGGPGLPFPGAAVEPSASAAADPEPADAVPADAVPSAAGSPAAAVPAVAPDPGGVPTMLILDASGSMVRDVPTGGTRMDAARAAATTLVQGLDPASELGLTVFGTGTGNSDAERAAGCSDVTVLQPVQPVDTAGFTAAIAGIVESGFTPIGPALRSAAEQLPADEPATIVLVSDGVDTCSPPSSCEVAGEVLTSHPLLSIEVIGFAVDADEQAQSQLQCIATLGSGSYVDAADADQLAARLRAATATGDLVTAEGYGRARLGMTLEQARFALDGFSVTEETAEIVYVDCADATLEFHRGVLTVITPKGPTATADGITEGSDVAIATAVYGTPSAPVRLDDGWSVDYASTPGSASGYRIVYDGPDGGLVSGTILRIIVCTCGPSVSEANAASSLVSSWQVSLDAVGPIRLGESFEDVSADVTLTGEGVPEYCTWSRSVDTGTDSVSMSVVAWADAEIEHVSLISIWAPSAFAAASRSWRDVGLGSSLAQVLQAHPDAAVIRDVKYGDYAVVGGPSGSSLFFLLDTDADYVFGITLSESPELPYEVCL